MKIQYEYMILMYSKYIFNKSKKENRVLNVVNQFGIVVSVIQMYSEIYLKKKHN